MEFFVDLMENAEATDAVPSYTGCYCDECNEVSCSLGGCY